MFDRARRSFHPITGLAGLTVKDDEVLLDLDTRGGAPVRGRITFPAPAVARIQWRVERAPDEHRTEMLVADPPRLPLVVEESDERVVIRADAEESPSLVLDRRPWRVRFGPYASERDDTSLVEWVAEPGGYAVHRGRDGGVAAYETFALAPGEELYGLGERFLGPGLRGRRLSHWIDEPYGTNTADRVYKSVPLVVSSRGYGLFAHHPEEAVFDLGAGSTASASVLVHADQLDLFVLLGPPKEVLRQYTALTGRAPAPPEWSFGVWMSRCMYQNRAQVAEVVETAERLGVPIGVVSLDPMWLADRGNADFDTCDFVWSEERFGPLDEFVDWLHGKSLRLCLWVNPHVRSGTAAWQAARLVEGGGVRDPQFPERGYVDFTGAGSAWWTQEMARLAGAGVDAFKLDYGETLPPEARLADGRTGAEAHNLYPLLAAAAAAAAAVPVHFTRSGTAGSQRHPLHWAGDSQSTWAGLRGALQGGLAAAWSGFAHWTSDIGGFYRRDLNADDGTMGFRQVDAELYIRWMQFGMLCSHTRFHGMAAREPWHFGDEAVAVARAFGELRRRLVPYLIECAEEAEATGCPIMRPTALEFPDDPGARHVDTQYLLGPSLLVCPVLEPGGTVEAYVPEGRWTDHFTGEAFSGPRWVRFEGVPLDRLPLMVRSDGPPVWRW